MAKVTLLPDKSEYEVGSQKNLYSELCAQGVAVPSQCGGFATCGQCVVKIHQGEENINLLTFEEKKLLGNTYHLTKERLSCQCTLSGPVTIEIVNAVARSGKSETGKSLKTVRRSKVQLENPLEENSEEKPKKVREGGFSKPKAFRFSEENKKKDEE